MKKQEQQIIKEACVKLTIDQANRQGLDLRLAGDQSEFKLEPTNEVFIEGLEDILLSMDNYAFEDILVDADYKIRELSDYE